MMACKCTCLAHGNAGCDCECRRHPAEPPKAPDDSLTFACAMALDPSEVEVEVPDFRPTPMHNATMTWVPLVEAADQVTFLRLRSLKFRRSRPKLTKPQRWYALVSDQRCATATIQRVCEELRAGQVPGGDEDDSDIADRLSRHFLEPR